MSRNILGVDDLLKEYIFKAKLSQVGNDERQKHVKRKVHT